MTKSATRRIDPSWIALWILTLGLLLIMIGARPELQPRTGKPEAVGPAIALVGHGVTWSAAAFMGVRAWRKARSTAPSVDLVTAQTSGHERRGDGEDGEDDHRDPGRRAA